MHSNKELNSIVTELFIRGRELNISFVFITQSYFAVPKNISPNSMHYFLMKTPSEQKLQQTTPANIRLDEDVLIKTNMFALALRLQKTSSRRLQDVLVKTNIFVLAIRLQDVLQKHLQNIFKKSCKNVFKTVLRCLAKASSRLYVLVKFVICKLYS